MEELINASEVHLDLLGPKHNTAQVLLQPSQSLTMDLQFFQYCSAGVQFQQEESWSEVKQAKGRRGITARRVLISGSGQLEYVGLGQPGGGPILVLNPALVCSEGLFVRDTHLLCTSGLSTIYSE